jgi:hypothetical protein
LNAVITCLFTSIPNPMCPGCDNYPSDPEILREWVSSIAAGTEACVVHDGWIGWPEQVQLQQWKPGGELWQHHVAASDENLFFQRWRHIRDVISAEDDIDFWFVTDGSDVRMLNEPWAHLDESMDIYVGSEEEPVSNKWIVANHPSIRPLAKRSPNRPLMNAGLLGGHRLAVLTFIDLLIARFPECEGDLTDMGAFNLVLAEDWSWQAVTGEPVHTPFRAMVREHPVMWFAHK